MWRILVSTIKVLLTSVKWPQKQVFLETIDAITEFAVVIGATEVAVTAASIEAVLSALESRLITDLRGIAPP